MAIPDEDRNPHRHPYGDYNRVSADGKYYFEWTPFTPAIVAWRNAAKHLHNARDRLVDAGKLRGFGFASLRQQHAEFLAALRALADEVDEAAREAEQRVVPALDAANAQYAAAADVSLQDYNALMSVVDGELISQGRKRKPLGPR
jgi:hypothetical protein